MPDGANLVIGQINTGTSTTSLQQSGKQVPALSVNSENDLAIFAASSNAVAIRGVSERNFGIVGQSSLGAGVWGRSDEAAGIFGTTFAVDGVGVLGGANNNAGVGVYGLAAFGVVGVSNGNNNAGVVGLASGDSPGVWGHTRSTDWPGVGGRASGTTSGVFGLCDGPAGPANNGVLGFSTNGNGVVGIASSPGSYGGLFYGGLAVSGPKSAAVKHRDGSHRLFYSLESPESWFEDFGRARLLRGKGEVKLDPSFTSFVRMDDYHVFLSPEGPSKGLYVSRRSRTGFSVREYEGGVSTLAFSYRIVARRKDLKIKRFKPVRLPVFDKNKFLKRPKSPAELTPPSVATLKSLAKEPMQFRGRKSVQGK